MRVFIAAIAALLGSAAFQMSIEAGYARDFIWLIPWCWGGCAALWTAWVLTHDKIVKEWLRGLHDKLGKGVYVVRTLICLCVFLAVYLMVGRWANKTVTVASATSQSSPVQGNSQSTTVNGDKNNTGNVTQNGDNNNAVIGNNNKVGNTYNLSQGNRIGWLHPSHKPTPDISYCDIELPSGEVSGPQSGDLIILLGDTIGWVGKANPPSNPITVVAIRDHPVLTISRNKNGEIAVSGEIFNPQDDAVVVMRNNKFTTSNEAFLVDATRSTLEITVKHLNETVLAVRYLNPSAVSVTGHFYYQGRDVLVSDHEIVVNPGRTHISKSCTGNPGKGMFAVN